jgi:site-specific DNA-methyltransferase (adenine-specific)
VSDFDLRFGDCLDPVTGLASLADKSVDHVITDPPYEAEAHEKGKRQNPTRDNHVRVVDEDFSFAAITEEQRTECARQWARVSRSWVLVFCQVEAVTLWKSALENAGLVYRRTVPWVKPDAMPSLHGRWPGQAFEAIVLAGRSGCPVPPIGGKAKFYSHTRKRFPRGDRPHPTMKPDELMAEIVEDFTEPGDVVLDPFMGSGTTGVACHMLGRRFIGWEMNTDYFEIAKRRINGEEAKPRPEQPSLFGGAA